MSIAEEEGIPFETRCRMAKEHLRGYVEFFKCTAEHSLEYLQQSADDKKKVLESIKVLPEEKRKKAVDLAEAFSLGDKFVEAEARFNRERWDHALSFSKDCFGEDATEFALEQLTRERGGS